MCAKCVDVIQKMVDTLTTEPDVKYTHNRDESDAVFTRLGLEQPGEDDTTIDVMTPVLHKILDRLDALEAK